MNPFKKQIQTTTLPPTIGIKDPETRAFLDAMVNAWDLRSGNTNIEDKERFVTLGEINKFADNAIRAAFSKGVVGGANGGLNGGESDIRDLIDNLADSIRKSILYQILGTEIQPIDLSALRARIDAAIGEMGAAILREETIRQSADEQFASTLTMLMARLGTAEAAIAEEREVRVTKDSALAKAINTIWASVGGNQAVIQDGSLAAVTPAAVQATKWDQVVASVTDPNTGNVSSTSIKQELIAYAGLADDKFNAIYTVRAQLSRDGRTIVGGFGLSATDGAGSADGPTIDFGVRADTFWIASTTSSGTVADQMAPNKNDIPFIVVTAPQYYGGILYQPGVYMKAAFIVDASITNAKIGRLIYSDNFNGTVNESTGMITSYGTQGWAIDKSGNSVFNNLLARGDLSSINYAPGVAGWKIWRDGNAEFNGIVLSRPNIVRSGIYDASGITVSMSVQDGWSSGVKTPGPITRPAAKSDILASILIDTGYSVPKDVGDANGPGFTARVLAVSGGWYAWWNGATPSNPIYDVYPDVSVGFYNTFQLSGAQQGSGEYGRIYIRLNVAIDLFATNIHTIRLGNFRWELARIT